MHNVSIKTSVVISSYVFLYIITDVLLYVSKSICHEKCVYINTHVYIFLKLLIVTYV